MQALKVQQFSCFLVLACDWWAFCGGVCWQRVKLLGRERVTCTRRGLQSPEMYDSCGQLSADYELQPVEVVPLLT